MKNYVHFLFILVFFLFFQLDQGGLNLPTRDNYLNRTAHKKVLDAYLDYMTRICVLLGANKTEARAQMNRVILFETELANITTPSEDRRDEEGLYNPYTIETWQKQAPFLNWSMFFNDAFKLINKTVSFKYCFITFHKTYYNRSKFRTDLYIFYRYYYFSFCVCRFSR